MQAWFLSDIHLKTNNEEKSLILLNFLHDLGVKNKATHLFLVGDIFDLWVGDSNHFFKKYSAVVNEIIEVRKRGIEVHYFEGNHDVHIEKFWKAYDVKTYFGVKKFKINEWVVRVEHGDYINPDDKTYLKYLETIHKPFFKFIAYLVPGKFWDDVGKKASDHSRAKSSSKRLELEDFLRSKLRLFAKTQSAIDDFDFLVTGHIHIRDDFVFEKSSGRQVRSVNLGSWFDSPMAFYLDEVGGSWISIKNS